MFYVSVTICRYVNDAFPGLVECKLTDAQGREWLFVEKVPIVTEARLDENSHYPQSGVIACEVIGRRQEGDGQEIVTIDTSKPWHVESISGETRFDILAEQLTELE